MFQDRLAAKKASYVAVAKNGTWLFEIVRRVCLLHPVYYVSTASLCDLFVQAIKSRDRGRGCPGRLILCSLVIVISTAM